jgi:hypothetical protein
MYLVSYGQFNDVVCQENGKGITAKIIVPSFDALGHDKAWQALQPTAERRAGRVWLADHSESTASNLGTTFGTTIKLPATR